MDEAKNNNDESKLVDKILESNENIELNNNINKRKDVEEIKKLDLIRVKKLYSKYLESLDWTKNNIDTAMKEAFFIWEKSSKEMFWDTVLSKSFDSIARKELKFLLNIRTTKGINSRFGEYLFQLQHFRQYVIVEYHVEMMELKKKSRENKDFERKYNVDIPKPSNQQMLIYISKHKNIKEYYYKEKALDKLFTKLCANNNDIEDILLKVCSLDDIYDLNVFSTYQMAKHILDLDTDVRLKVGDITLVEDICKIKNGHKTKSGFSFATKYCSFHKPDLFPMYDEYIEEILKYFRDKDKFAEFKDEDIYNYMKYKGIIIDFKKFYKLGRYDFRKIEQYLYQLGKEFFSEKI